MRRHNERRIQFSYFVIYLPGLFFSDPNFLSVILLWLSLHSVVGQNEGANRRGVEGGASDSLAERLSEGKCHETFKDLPVWETYKE